MLAIFNPEMASFIWIFFSIFLVIAFALGASAALIAIVIGYTILSLITAFLVKLFCSRRRFYPHCPEYYNFNNTLYEAEDLNEDNGSYFNYQYNQEPNCRCNNRFRNWKNNFFDFLHKESLFLCSKYETQPKNIDKQLEIAFCKWYNFNVKRGEKNKNCSNIRCTWE